ncbi:hypothetical protein PR003_g27218 [Phytophthora rubi]|uniref:Uncharacterized protein n=1 Tax=Phytophthora rubi TaxID=129364 RepID=A0A6A3J5F1_9STRA|nr:hypothetical protein PR001_g26007 [Phytophthora rubi]KAE8989522.1 hypothetical protein PR002_g21418 [Phytophthora rubi]KAE9283120.1 hypothetical protein PR003_g27218 [Phytophthora rubi]
MLIKPFTKQNIANAAKNLHEYVGPMIPFSVDLFNVAVCMQTAKSLVTSLIIIAADGILVVVALRGNYHRTGFPEVKKERRENIFETCCMLSSAYLRSRALGLTTNDQLVFLPFALSISDECCDCLSKTALSLRMTSQLQGYRVLELSARTKQKIRAL